MINGTEAIERRCIPSDDALCQTGVRVITHGGSSYEGTAKCCTTDKCNTPAGAAAPLVGSLATAWKMIVLTIILAVLN